MRTRTFGATGLEVSVIGYGAMPLSVGDRRPQSSEADAILDCVLDCGVTFLDTADTYCASPDELHHNERLISHVLKQRPAEVLVATKGGTVRTANGWELDGHPDHIYAAICESYAALGGTAPIPLWQHHWPDPRYSVTEMLRPVCKAVDEGLIQFAGVGNYTLDQLCEACDCLPIASIQNQYNLWHREPESNGLFDYCVANEIVFLPWRPMGGSGLAERLGEIDALKRLADDRGVSPQRVMIAWHLAQSPCILPFPGSTSCEHIADCLAAADFILEPQELAALNRLHPEELPQRVRRAAWQAHPPLFQHCEQRK